MSRVSYWAPFLLVSASLVGCEPKTAPVAPSSTVDGASDAAAGTAPASPTSPASGADAGADAASPQVKTLFVRETQIDCEGEGPMKCMQVRESEKEDWSLFYGSIEGFTYEPSFAYELRVSVKPTAKPPAGASSMRYRLVEIVSKKPVPPHK